MNNSVPFLVTKSAFVKAIFAGHATNIAIGVASFIGAHYGLHLSTEMSVAVTVVATAIGALMSSYIATRKLSRPVHALNSEIAKLNDKINASTSALSNVNEDLKALLEDLPLGLLVFNDEMQVTRINEVATKLLGASVDASTEALLAIVSKLKSNGQTINFIDWLHQAKTDKIQDLKRWPMVVLNSADNTAVFDLLAHYNKHDSHSYELVVMLVDRSEEYDRQEKQMEFISLAAHELRGPITVMRGLIDVLQHEAQDQLDDDHQELLTRMGISARQLAGYVDNILNVSRVDRETFEVHPDEEDWSKLLTSACQDMAIRAQANHRKLELHIAKSLPTAAVDTTAISHVITNLIDNAIKYSKDGGTVIVNAISKDSQIETTIQDFGIGIPDNVLSNLFVKFYRSHRSKQIVSGTGLGLYLCKAIIEAHGGNIWVRSSEGAGTTFGFTLPTYASVADQLKEGNNKESGIVRGSHGWIKNHSLYQR